MSGRHAIAALAAAVLVLACGVAGWAWEMTARPRLRGAGWAGDADGGTPPDHELEDRVARKIRSGAPAREVEAALDELREAGSPGSHEPEALLARRAAWWRDRIAGMPAPHRPMAIERALAVGFTREELDLLPRTPERETELVRRIGDPSSSPEDARGWARALARGPLGPEAEKAAIDLLPTLEPTRRLAVVGALAGTHTPAVVATLGALLVDPAEDLAVRRFAAARLAKADARLSGLDPLLAVLLDGSQPEPLRADVFRDVTVDVDLRRHPEVERALIHLLLDSAAPKLLREQAAWQVGHRVVLGRDERRALLRLALDTSAPESLRRAVLGAVGRLAFDDATAVDEERAMLESIAGSATEPRSLRDAASTALRRMSPRAAPARSQRPVPPPVGGQP